ncbi:MAG TPA: hypothetical protein VFQ65_14310, partial [Kofleriaceae bacterium]|nr:hypothetical protein [Kofleriaceae bacterium]
MWRAWFLVVVACSSNNPYASAGSGSAVVVPPAGTTARAANDRCEVDDDCVIALPPSSACCPHSGPPIAMTADHKRNLVPPPDVVCSQDAVASCSPPVAQDLWPDAVCKDHTCIARPHVAPVFDTSPFSRACAKDADCTLVEADPCNPCRCENFGIAVAQRGRYLEAFRAFKSDRTGHGCFERDRKALDVTITPCVHCDEVAPVCNHGQCEAKSTEPVPVGGECASDADCVISCASKDHCCEATPCEDVIAKSKLAEVLAAQPDCKAVRCRAPDRPTYL